jgi:hypothetical protein
MGGYRFIVDHVHTDDGSGDASAARELACTWWYGMFRRPDEARPGSPGTSDLPS